MESPARDLWDETWRHQDLETLMRTCLGPLAAIGEQKATQLFAQLASRFDKTAGSTYEAIFAAWGGDVRERSLDLTTGKLRPREITLPSAFAHTPPSADLRLTADPTVYARVDYLDPNAKLTKEEKASCQAILQDLPVVFTFAPMNLLYYQAKFPAHGARLVTVSYRQYAFADTRGTGSYQLAYVLHPATLWKEFGPIHLTFSVPEGVACRASTVVEPASNKREKWGGMAAEEEWQMASQGATVAKYRASLYETTLDKASQKQGELFVAVDKAAWDKAFRPAKPKPAPVQRQMNQTSQR